MELFVKLGDQTVTITQMLHSQKSVGAAQIPIDAHKAVLSDSLTGDMELLQFASETEALQFIREFLDPQGYPPGGLYDSLVKSPGFRM